MPPFMLIPLAFLAGSIPFGFLIARAKGLDIRAHGSGNIGATNVGRVLGKKFGILCFALDFIKGFAPTLAAGLVLGTAQSPTSAPLADVGLWLAAMSAAMLGHVFTPWLGFKGGKGVATGFGAIMGVWPVLTLPAVAAFATWYAVLKLSRYTSVASCAAAAALPLWVALGGLIAVRPTTDTSAWPIWPYLAVASTLAAIAIFMHRTNIKRLRLGTEPKLGQRAEPGSSATTIDAPCTSESRP